MKYILRTTLPIVFVASGIAADHFSLISDHAYWALFGAAFGTVNAAFWMYR